MNLRLIYDFSKLRIAMAAMGSGETIDIGRVTSQKDNVSDTQPRKPPLRDDLRIQD
jgi:hypothetical protein